MTLKNAKAKGARLEHRSMRLLEAAGYRCLRSRGSLGEWDVVGVSLTDWICLQIKANRRPGTLELAALRDFQVPANTRKLLHVWKDRAKLPLVEDL